MLLLDHDVFLSVSGDETAFLLEDHYHAVVAPDREGRKVASHTNGRLIGDLDGVRLTVAMDERDTRLGKRLDDALLQLGESLDSHCVVSFLVCSLLPVPLGVRRVVRVADRL